MEIFEMWKKKLIASKHKKENHKIKTNAFISKNVALEL